MPAEIFSAIAGAAIAPSVFVKVSTAADNTVLTASTNEAVIGVATDAAMNAPITGASANAAVAAGDPIAINPLGSVCLLKIGSGGCTRGAQLVSDSSGFGVAAGATGQQNVGAIALESAAQNELARVLVWRDTWYGT